MSAATDTMPICKAEAKDRLIVALDVPSADDALKIVDEIGSNVGAFKIGLELFTSSGPDFVRRLCGEGHRIFLDLKFHDIPNTVAGAVLSASRLGVWMMNVHCLGGKEMLLRAKDALDSVDHKGNFGKPLLIGVTILTSHGENDLSFIGLANKIDENVERLSMLAKDCGLDGVVASAHEAAMIRRNIPDQSFSIVTPGIRPLNATLDDQTRVLTMAEAIRSGADHVVVGRPITRSADRIKAIEQILEGVEITD